MNGLSKLKFFASVIVAFCWLATFAAPAMAQVAYPSTSLNNPGSCPAFNRNWQCTGAAPLAIPFTTCVQTVVNGVIVDQRNRTFSGEAGFTQFLLSAPAGTVYQQCGAPPSCTQTTETRTLPCPSGQNGVITQTRTVNTGGVCGAFGAYTETGNTCQVPPSTVCVNPFGGTLQVGQSITAYATQTTAFGTVCISQVRVCQANGTLTGSYTFQTCSVNPPLTCALPWGGTIANGQSVTAYKKVTINQASTTNTNATVINNLCAIAQTSNLFVSAGACVDLATAILNGNLSGGAQTLAFDFCLSETRTCVNGVLTGSYTEQTCTATPSCTQTTETRTNGQQCPAGSTGTITETRTVNTGGVCGVFGSWTVTSNTCTANPTCTQTTETRTNGQQCPAGQTGTITETRTVNTGGVCGSFGSWTVTSNTCTTPTPQSCTLPWGGTIASGQSVIAYLESTVANGGTCFFETRTCTNGVLSGSYTKQSCVIQQPQTCALPWGGTIANGQSVTAYATQTTAFGTVCTSQTRTCNNGTLSGSYTFQTCTMNQAQNCTLPWGGTLANGQSVTAYATQTIAFGTVCASQVRTCSNGTLSGSYTFQTCTMNQAQNCTLPWGGTLANGQSVTAYLQSNPAQNTACSGQTRTCNNGVLSGSYTSGSCTQVICTTAQAGDATATACTTTGYNGGGSTGSTTTTNITANQNQNQSQEQAQSQANQTASQSEAQQQQNTQGQGANINVSNSGGGTVEVGVQQSQAQSGSQSQNQSSSSPGGTLNQGQNQAEAQAQAQEIWDRIYGALGRTLTTNSSSSQSGN